MVSVAGATGARRGPTRNSCDRALTSRKPPLGPTAGCRASGVQRLGGGGGERSARLRAPPAQACTGQGRPRGAVARVHDRIGRAKPSGAGPDFALILCVGRYSPKICPGRIGRGRTTAVPWVIAGRIGSLRCQCRVAGGSAATASRVLANYPGASLPVPAWCHSTRTPGRRRTGRCCSTEAPLTREHPTTTHWALRAGGRLPRLRHEGGAMTPATVSEGLAGPSPSAQSPAPPVPIVHPRRRRRLSSSGTRC